MMYQKCRVALLAVFLSCICLPLAHAHSRWSCPEPRSPSTSIKDGPCGDETNNFSASQEVVEIAPGPLRVVFEESIYHTGAPFRISLSGDGTDTSPCSLLDHIPHSDGAPRPTFRDESTYTQYAVTIDIPDVNCERCSLHLSNPMTDKIGSAGSPTGIGCTDPDGTCFSVYYSCTKPFRILGSSSAMPRSEYQCQYDSESGPEDWPASWIGDSGEFVDASIPGVYRRESSRWNAIDFTLESAPMRYRQDAGGLCGNGVGPGDGGNLSNQDSIGDPRPSQPTATAEEENIIEEELGLSQRPSPPDAPAVYQNPEPPSTKSASYPRKPCAACISTSIIGLFVNAYAF
mmetsp:Transcript_4842/g.13676  ORF Transcript_4842/g.13676 Transcript_4842/m.13676 type:complete len:345 (-) Transcript_4842:629-1663(-)|eukprot:CAMPEP_0181028542 /NCGR_PEP_ID=MMETSP1070-20121207/4723_1 /TAXON_ID=265543 /ORGANISM="Minutocellus polymorphus, Strain NH13" /LENGTH=344 /DNA_ID=CAMNT_0023105797 /DNA_START=44 /DNA_END=1078 /DNA_ORIENTATION=+